MDDVDRDVYYVVNMRDIYFYIYLIWYLLGFFVGDRKRVMIKTDVNVIILEN